MNPIVCSICNGLGIIIKAIELDSLSPTIGVIHGCYSITCPGCDGLGWIEFPEQLPTPHLSPPDES